MRIHGTLTKWNDDRGFGFITPAKATGELFVHISAFPRDGIRPRLNELISFETETAPDGRQRATKVMRPAQKKTAAPVTKGVASHRGRKRGLAATLSLLIVGILGAYAYSRFASHTVPDAMPDQQEFTLPEASSAKHSCDGRTMCSEMRSCAEARYFIRNCPNTLMDGDNDGVPCESQWCTD